MKALHLLNSDRFSGAENVVCQIFSMMKDEPDMEMLYCSPDGPIREALKERDVPFAAVSSLSVPELKRVIKAFQPDVIHAHDMRASFVAARACGKIPYISHIHNNAYNSRGISVKSIAYFFAAKKASHIFWVSKSSFEGYCFRRFFKEKSSILYNVISVDGINRRAGEDKETYPYDVVYVGRLTYPKNPRRLIMVMKKCIEQEPTVKFAIVGTGELEEETKQTAYEMGLLENISFLGFRSNPLKILHDAKVMIMTSRWEGLPMCALEALTLGVPVVSTPTDGMVELIEEGKDGFLSDDDDVLADRILQILSKPELREEMSVYAKEKAIRANDVENYRGKLLKVYKN